MSGNTRQTWTFRAIATRLVVLVVVSATLFYGFRDIDLRIVGAALARVGGYGVLLALPFFVILSLDTVAWRALLRLMGEAPQLWPLFQVRVASEALLLSIPGGSVASDGVTPWLLQRSGGTPLATGAASVLARKASIIFANGLYMALGVSVGFGLYAAVSQALVGGPFVHFAAFASALVMSGATWALWRWARDSPTTPPTEEGRSLPWPGFLRAWLVARREAVASFRGSLCQAARAGGRRWAWVVLLYLAHWLMEPVESLLLAKLLGFELSFADAIAMDTAVYLVRSLAFFVPAGLGFQDVGYALFFASMGMENGVELGAAFAVLRRVREVVWIAVGYLFLAQNQWRAREMGLATSA